MRFNHIAKRFISEPSSQFLMVIEGLQCNRLMRDLRLQSITEGGVNQRFAEEGKRNGGNMKSVTY